MDLDSQIQALVDDAPRAGVAPSAITAIAPVLTTIAQQLKHEQYYILQNLEQGWVMTTLNNRQQGDVQKNIIYAFPTLADVALGPHPVKDPQVMALPVPVTHILFQMLAMKPVTSVIFFDTPGNVRRGVEVKRDEIQKLVQLSLQQAGPAAAVPPDIA